MQVRETRSPQSMWGALKEANPEVVVERRPYSKALCKIRVLLDDGARISGYIWEDLLDEKPAVLTVLTSTGSIKAIPGRLDQCETEEEGSVYLFSPDDIRVLEDLYTFVDHGFTGCSNALQLVVIGDPPFKEEKGGLVLPNLLFRCWP